MYEVELKVRADHDPVRERLAAVDARSEGTVRQTDTYYDAPDRDFAETDEALRVREVTHSGSGTTETRVTYKGPLVEAASKTRQEAETAVADGATLADILSGLGYEPAATVAKERDRYEVEGYTVVLDDVNGLGEFVEVETEVETEEAVESAREGAVDLLERLGLDAGATIRTSYLELVLSD